LAAKIADPSGTAATAELVRGEPNHEIAVATRVRLRTNQVRALIARWFYERSRRAFPVATKLASPEHL
jgi:hypothetical protein